MLLVVVVGDDAGRWTGIASDARCSRVHSRIRGLGLGSESGLSKPWFPHPILPTVCFCPCGFFMVLNYPRRKLDHLAVFKCTAQGH